MKNRRSPVFVAAEIADRDRTRVAIQDELRWRDGAVRGVQRAGGSLTQDAFIARLGGRGTPAPAVKPSIRMLLDDPVARDAYVKSLAARDCGCSHRDGSRADVDNSAWDGAAAMSACAQSSTPSSCYGAICAGRKSGDAALQSSWALPHHRSAGAAPNAAGVRNALARIDQTQGLTNKADARAHLEAHLKAINAGGEKAMELGPLVRANLIRGGFRSQGGHPVIALRSAGTAGAQPTLEGHFAVFNEWTLIDSIWEGTFMESIAPGAFAKTIRENVGNMRVLFQHGRDPSIGDKPLGPIETLDEDNVGAHYVVPLLDTTYNADLIPGLREGLYGASFRFSVIKDEINEDPGRSPFNPDGLPQRVIREMKLHEFGPVTFPAYASATAGLRGSRGFVSLTDDLIKHGKAA